MGILGLLAIVHTVVYGVMTWEQDSRGNPLIRMQFMLLANLALAWGFSALSHSGIPGLLGIGAGAYGTYFLWAICLATEPVSVPKPKSETERQDSTEHVGAMRRVLPPSHTLNGGVRL